MMTGVRGAGDQPDERGADGGAWMWRLARAVLLACSLALAACGSSPGSAPATPPAMSSAAAPSIPTYVASPPATRSEEPTAGPTAGQSAIGTPSGATSGTGSPVPSVSAGPASVPGVIGAWASACGTAVHVTPTGVAAEPSALTDVRLADHGGVQRVVFAFAGDTVPAVDIAPAAPPFVRDGSGLPVEVPGAAHLRIHFPFATGMATYAGPAVFAGDVAPLVSLVRTGDFEAVLSWVAGLSGPACYRVSILGSPIRVVIDLSPVRPTG